MGGLEIDAEFKVMKVNCKPIPGPFAASEIGSGFQRLNHVRRGDLL